VLTPVRKAETAQFEIRCIAKSKLIKNR